MFFSLAVSVELPSARRDGRSDYTNLVMARKVVAFFSVVRGAGGGRGEWSPWMAAASKRLGMLADFFLSLDA